MKRIPSLDGLRAVSISLVVAGHWVELHYQSSAAADVAGGGVGGGVFCDWGGGFFFCYFGISDYDSVVERVWQDLNDWVAGILCAAGLPDFAGGDCIYGAGVCD